MTTLLVANDLEGNRSKSSTDTVISSGRPSDRPGPKPEGDPVTFATKDGNKRTIYKFNWNGDEPDMNNTPLPSEIDEDTKAWKRRMEAELVMNDDQVKAECNSVATVEASPEVNEYATRKAAEIMEGHKKYRGNENAEYLEDAGSSEDEEAKYELRHPAGVYFPTLSVMLIPLVLTDGAPSTLTAITSTLTAVTSTLTTITSTLTAVSSGMCCPTDGHPLGSQLLAVLRWTLPSSLLRLRARPPRSGRRRNPRMPRTCRTQPRKLQLSPR